MHTQSSRTYRQHCIAIHEQQNFATMMVLMYFERRYPNCIKHRNRILNAVREMRGQVQ